VIHAPLQAPVFAGLSHFRVRLKVGISVRRVGSLRRIEILNRPFVEVFSLVCCPRLRRTPTPPDLDKLTSCFFFWFQLSFDPLILYQGYAFLIHIELSRFARPSAFFFAHEFFSSAPKLWLRAVVRARFTLNLRPSRPLVSEGPLIKLPPPIALG